jgi:hypothetical protein
MIHALKTDVEYFGASAAGAKEFEVRKNDRGFKVDDFVALNEWDGEKYTGRCTLHKIIYILDNTEYCKEGYVILGLKPCAILAKGEEKIKDCRIGEAIPVYDRDQRGETVL